MNSRWSGILMGSAVALAIETALILLGIGIGFVVFPFERVGEEWKWIGFGISSGIFLGLSMAIAYFVGGFIASRLHQPHQKGEICFQGLATWGTASILGMFLIMSLLSKTVLSAGTGAGMLAAMDSLAKAKPRIITDFSILKGKAVTSVDLGTSSGAIVNNAQKELSTEKAKDAIETARKATAAACLVGFFSILINGVSAAFGAWFGRPTPLSVVPAVRRQREAA